MAVELLSEGMNATASIGQASWKGLEGDCVSGVIGRGSMKLQHGIFVSCVHDSAQLIQTLLGCIVT